MVQLLFCKQASLILTSKFVKAAKTTINISINLFFIPLLVNVYFTYSFLKYILYHLLIFRPNVMITVYVLHVPILFTSLDVARA